MAHPHSLEPDCNQALGAWQVFCPNLHLVSLQALGASQGCENCFCSVTNPYQQVGLFFSCVSRIHFFLQIKSRTRRLGGCYGAKWPDLILLPPVFLQENGVFTGCAEAKVIDFRPPKMAFFH